MVVPIVVSETEMPIIRPSVKMLLTSGLPHSDVGSELMVDVQRLRIMREAREQRVVHLGRGAADGVLDHAADLELVVVKALHLHRLTPAMTVSRPVQMLACLGGLVRGDGVGNIQFSPALHKPSKSQR